MDDRHTLALPRYARFARALALIGAASTSGCYQAHELPSDTGPITMSDAGHDTGPFDCRSCMCGPPPSDCQTRGHSECCIRTGPLPPPDLHA